MNLEDIGLEEMSITEIQETEGGLIDPIDLLYFVGGCFFAWGFSSGQADYAASHR